MSWQEAELRLVIQSSVITGKVFSAPRSMTMEWLIKLVCLKWNSLLSVSFQGWFSMHEASREAAFFSGLSFGFYNLVRDRGLGNIRIEKHCPFDRPWRNQGA